MAQQESRLKGAAENGKRRIKNPRIRFRQHASHPRNPRLAHALYRARLIEHWGTGTLRIVRACEGSNIGGEFSIQAGSFVARLLKKPQPPIEGGGKEAGERVGKRVGESPSAK